MPLSWHAALNRFAQINHVPELNAVFVYGVVIVGYEEVPHDVGADKAAFFIEGDSEWAVTGTNLQYRETAGIFALNKINERFSVSLLLRFGADGDILNSSMPQPSSVTTPQP